MLKGLRRSECEQDALAVHVRVAARGLIAKESQVCRVRKGRPATPKVN